MNRQEVLSEVRVLFIVVEDNNSGKNFPPKMFSSNVTLQQAAKESGIDIKEKIFKFNQQTINDPQQSLQQIKKENNISAPILPIRIFKKAIGGELLIPYQI